MKITPISDYQILVTNEKTKNVLKSLMSKCHIHKDHLNSKDDWYFIEIARVTAEALGHSKVATELEILLDFISKHDGVNVKF